MTPRATDRRGFALAIALMAIVVIGVLIAGAFFSSTQEFRVGRNTLVSQRAFAIAEYGLNQEISNWDRARNLPGGMSIGDTVARRDYVSDNDTAWVTITKLTDNTFWVVSEGEASMDNLALRARQRTNAIVHIAYPTVSFQGALTTAGDVDISGSAHISGTDATRANPYLSAWGQCSTIADSSTAGVAIAPSARVQSRDSSRIDGSPAITRTTAASDSNTYIRYGTETWNTLQRNADLTLPAGTSPNPAPVGDSLSCTLGPDNWGEPYRGGGAIRGCYNYFPIVYYDGDLTIQSNGRGQGILLVNGDLRIRGTFEYYGIIIVKDDVERDNGTANIYGTLMARNASFGQGDDMSTFTGNQNVLFSNCAVQSALRGSAILVPVRQRGWAQLF